MSTNLVLAGVVGGARGLQGEVYVEVRTDRPDSVFESGSKLHLQSPPGGARTRVSPGVFADGLPRELSVESSRVHSGRLSLSFAEVSTREQAEALRGFELMTPELSEDDAWYPHELVGLRVEDSEGKPLGTVSGLAQGAAHDFLLVDHDGTEVMVPLVTEIVPDVSIEEGRVVVDAPAGLFEEEQ